MDALKEYGHDESLHYVEGQEGSRLEVRTGQVRLTKDNAVIPMLEQVPGTTVDLFIKGDLLSLAKRTPNGWETMPLFFKADGLEGYWLSAARERYHGTDRLPINFCGLSQAEIRQKQVELGTEFASLTRHRLNVMHEINELQRVCQHPNTSPVTTRVGSTCPDCGAHC